jgi:hypothetical protein
VQGGYKPEAYEGRQFLRFDRARYKDFTARVVVKLRDWSRPENRMTLDPFPALSSSGQVGIAFRWQDRPLAGFGWGGAYAACLVVEPDSQRPITPTVRRWNGFSLSSNPNAPHALAPGADTDLHRRENVPTSGEVLPATRTCTLDDLFRPEGFSLTVRAVGRKFQMFLNDRPQPILEAEDPGPDGFDSGRIALYASRLIATFESLEVTPVPAP